MNWKLSKSRILSFLQCHKRVYLEVHRRDLIQYSASTEAVFDIGNEVGEIAQEVLMPDGVLIPYGPGLRKAVETTQNYLKDLFDITIYEATLQTGNVQIRADLLSRKKDFIDVIEVKSSTKVKDQNIIDCAIQYWVMDEAGFKPNKISLAHINNKFLYKGDMDYAGLFEVVNLTDDITPYVEQVPEWVSEANQIIAGEPPNIEVGEHCTKPYECPFMNHCWKDVAVTEYPIVNFPGLAKSKKQELMDEGYKDVRDVPEHFLEDSKLLARLNAYKNGESIIPIELKDELKQLNYPRYFLDFETIGFAIPRWKDTKPYEALPFQWSCHVEDQSGDISHFEFLDTTGEPPMKKFVETLINAVLNSGPIIVYSSYEKTILNKLTQRYPELEDELRSIIDRLYDILIPIKKYYFHRDLQGSYSIKKVLPTIVSDLNHTDLGEVQDGMMAQNAYVELISDGIDDERRKSLTDSLLSYCELDTFAMVKLVHKLSS
jgi:hypothetical protein